MLKCSFAFRIATNTATISFAGVMAENLIKSGGKIKKIAIAIILITIIIFKKYY